jgi:hypothetical protein
MNWQAKENFDVNEGSGAFTTWVCTIVTFEFAAVLTGELIVEPTVASPLFTTTSPTRWHR